mmetsp:Transcript_7705/g.28404  ORF Transcript_7705/g.28404 Transcript_7705/m.28404 type:complete len:617 (+) Transcript_7705:123-1973(+)
MTSRLSLSGGNASSDSLNLQVEESLGVRDLSKLAHQAPGGCATPGQAAALVLNHETGNGIAVDSVRMHEDSVPVYGGTNGFDFPKDNTPHPHDEDHRVLGEEANTPHDVRRLLGANHGPGPETHGLASGEQGYGDLATGQVTESTQLLPRTSGPGDEALMAYCCFCKRKRQKHRGSYTASSRTLGVLPLVALIFYEVSGGPFGIEESVGSGGPLLAILGFTIMPLVWSVPEALVTAEMATMFPDASGYVGWVQAAFGNFWGFQEGWLSWLSGMADNALYPILFLDYFSTVLPALKDNPTVRIFSVTCITGLLTFLNYLGLTVVGRTAIGLSAFTFIPFIVMIVLAIPSVNVSSFGELDTKTVDWGGFLNILFWNLNYWDSASTLAGEVTDPSRTFPRALFFSVILVVCTYLLPLMAAIGVSDVAYSDWDDNYFATVAEQIGGGWLKYWILAASAASNLGLFEAEMSSDSYQILGMAEKGMLPSILACRSRFGTPTYGILLSALGVVVLGPLSFGSVVEMLNFLYCIAALLEFSAFVWLRHKRPDLQRPFKVPLGTVGCMVLLLPAASLSLIVMSLASWLTLAVCGGLVVAGISAFYLIEYAKRKRWCAYTTQDSDC